MKRSRSAAHGKHQMIRKIRKPLPKLTGGVHIPKTAYRRKWDKDALRSKIKSQDWE